MLSKNTRNRFGLLLMRTSLRAKHELVRISEEHGLSPMQSLALCVLTPEEHVHMNSLAHPLSCDPSHVTGIVDRLEEAHYISRNDCEKDRRMKLIGLTKKGIALREELLHAYVAAQLPQLSALSDTEVEKLLSFLLKASDLPLDE